MCELLCAPVHQATTCLPLTAVEPRCCPPQAGWGKQLSYVIGVGRHGAADVTRRYTKDWAAVQHR